MKTIRMTMAQALVKFLNSQYISVDEVETRFVKGIFTIFGHGNVLGLGQALEQDAGELLVHQGRNEQGMAHAAMGFAKQMKRRQIYACTSSVGPGAANMVTVAATASANRIPVLLLPGDVYACRQPDPVLQQVEQFYDLSISTNDAFRAVSKYWDRVVRPEQLMTAMISAMRVLTDPENTGAVTIALPQDVQGEAYDYPESFFAKRIWRFERTEPTAAMLHDAVELITSKRRPLLVCGGGVRYSDAAEAFKTFAETFCIPFGETQAGKSALPYSHELNLGGIGTTGCLAANLIAKETDLVIGVGTRYTDFTTASKSLFQNPEVAFLNINIGGFDAMKLDGTPMRADAKTALQSLTEVLSEVGYCSSYTTEIEDARKAWANELDRLFHIDYTGEGFVPEVAGHLDHTLPEFAALTGCHLTQTRALGILDEYLDDDAVVVGASGSLPGDLQRVWRPKVADTYHMEYGYSCMGYEVNAALGAKMAVGDQEVYAMVGDGSYMMLHSELATSIQERQKINVLLFDNNSFGCINNLQMGTGMGSYGTETRFRSESGQLDGDFVPVDFAMNAAAYGCKTYTVRNDAELIAAIADSKNQTVSTLIDIKVFPKTMTHGYESWWRAGVAEVAEKASILAADAEMKDMISKSRHY
ncbi:MAG: 3D-(3,5/4)-trihydroxycyclohexane-1,2-dione acylhydrolase (decyclizing) [Spartobacteria bacterium]|nr:3D-(3,5/4)-trihydroxycyclohexane-1,2-dione acylhydrolase (decyclizing) [Spartobacteria bacterium]